MNDRNTLLQDLVSALKNMLSFHEEFTGTLKQSGVSITENQFLKLSGYVDLLKSKNEELNLTAITDAREIWIKHILDSLIVLPFIKVKPGMKVMDIGTGGGLPGIPLAIMFPSIQFVLVDSIQKKIAAVQEFAFNLNLKNVICIAERAETLGRDPAHRDQYDIVLTRAVAPLRVLAEITIPLIHLYGQAIAYKGPEYINELVEARNAVIKLQCESPKVYHYALPEDMGARTLILLTKKRVTPEMYPRREGMPSKRPL